MKSWKKLSLALLALTGLLAVAAKGRARAPDQFEVLTGFASKEACSCAFVVEQSDAYCTEFGQIDGYPTKIEIDREKKTVKATFNIVSRTAHFSEEKGCVTDELP